MTLRLAKAVCSKKMKPEEMKRSDQRTEREREAYPDELRCREAELLRLRRKGAEEGETGFRVGLALSGGGLRSATFSLGILQAMAGMRALDKVDALSTVSGGGYTGSMISRLFCRKSVHCVEDVERAISPRWNEGTNQDGREAECKERITTGSVFRWLQDNGNYLAPNGGGDLLLAAAVIARNWVYVQAMLVTLLLAGFTLMQLLRHLGAEVSQSGGWPQAAGRWLAGVTPDGFWWSPWFGVAFLLSLPYWIVPRSPKGGCPGVRVRGPSSGHRLSTCLKYSLLVVATLIGAALVDSLGQTAYVYWRIGKLSDVGLAGAVAIVVLVARARRLATVLLGTGVAERPKIPLRVAAGVVWSALFVAWVTSVNALSHGIA